MQAQGVVEADDVVSHTIEKADVCAWALYLFLVTVADTHGLSYYADASLSRRLGLDPRRLTRARSDLIELDLIAYLRLKVLTCMLPKI
jgi:hypothetical protein